MNHRFFQLLMFLPSFRRYPSLTGTLTLHDLPRSRSTARSRSAPLPLRLRARPLPRAAPASASSHSCKSCVCAAWNTNVRPAVATWKCRSPARTGGCTSAVARSTSPSGVVSRCVLKYRRYAPFSTNQRRLNDVTVRPRFIRYPARATRSNTDAATASAACAPPSSPAVSPLPVRLAATSLGVAGEGGMPGEWGGDAVRCGEGDAGTAGVCAMASCRVCSQCVRCDAVPVVWKIRW
mmetsp:Transcript_222/g.472  ORF Transcript_222/g.472 Transcript_222/m.472 type:complete len:236 (+) Transcript_222:1115-1822(+)